MPEVQVFAVGDGFLAVKIHSQILLREDDCVKVRINSALGSCAWVDASDVEVSKGDPEKAWLSCFLDDIFDGWLLVTMPGDGITRTVAVPVSEALCYDSTTESLERRERRHVRSVQRP